MVAPDSPPLTLWQLLRQSTETLRQAAVPSPEVDARELLLFALGLRRTALLTQQHVPVSQADAHKVQALVEQRAQRIPLQHLLGEVEWGALSLRTDARALIPRPETEVLLELAVSEGKRWLAQSGAAPLTVLDIGTGTGALALGLKAALSQAQVTATDLSAEALALAQENGARNALDITWVHTDLAAGVTGPFALVVSNPPYLPEADRLSAQAEVRHDPDLALYSGTDGLALPRRLVAQAGGLLAPGGTLLLELDPRNVAQLATEMTDWVSEILLDLTQRPRFLRARPRIRQS